MPSRQDNYIVYARVDGEDLGTFETWSGGDNDSDSPIYTEGGSNKVSIGGLQSRDAITIGRLFRSDRDLPIYPWLDSRCGKGIAEFIKQMLDDEENPVGVPIIRRGTLKKVTDPEADKNSSDPSTISLEMSPELPLPVGVASNGVPPSGGGDSRSRRRRI